jgi:hypothetical protein
MTPGRSFGVVIPIGNEYYLIGAEPFIVPSNRYDSRHEFVGAIQVCGLSKPKYWLMRLHPREDAHRLPKVTKMRVKVGKVKGKKTGKLIFPEACQTRFQH